MDFATPELPDQAASGVAGNNESNNNAHQPPPQSTSTPALQQQEQLQPNDCTTTTTTTTFEDLVKRANYEYEYKSRNKLSFELYEAASRIETDNGHVNFRLGVMYFYGWNTPENQEKANKYLSKALQLLSNRSDAESLCDLGYMHENGLGVTLNHNIAAQLYQTAGNLGSPRAQFNIANMYHHGRGVPSNIDMALKYYKLSAEQGYVKSLFLLGFLYHKGGFGVEVDLDVATDYLKTAFENGYGRAGYDLAEIYREKKDLKTSLMFHLRCSSLPDGTLSKSHLKRLFSGELGKSSKREALEILGEEYRNGMVFQTLQERCRNTIVECLLCLKRFSSISTDLQLLIVQFLITEWPFNHFDY